MSEVVLQPDDTLLDVHEVKRIVGLSTATIYRRMKAREFPLCAKIAPRSVRWLESEVKAWVGQKLQVRRA